MKFNSSYENRPKYKGEENSGEILTEVKGFIPAKRRIENLLQAGQNLEKARREMYDFPDGEDDGGLVSPDRYPGFDRVDADAAMAALKAKYPIKSDSGGTVVSGSDSQASSKDPDKTEPANKTDSVEK